MDNIEYLKKQLSIMLNLFQGKHFDKLIDKGNLLIKKFPEHAILYNLTSLAYNATGKPGESKLLLSKILKKEPNNIHVLNNLGLTCIELNDYEQAEIFYNKAIELNSNFPDALVNLGNLKSRQNKNDDAKDLFLKALEIDNNIIPAKISLAGFYEQKGSFDEAKNIYHEVLKINPNYTIADKSLSLIHKYKLNDPHIIDMQNKLTKTNDEEAVKRLSFALGKAYEDIGNYTKSFEFYKTGNKLYKKKIKFDINNEIKNFDKIKEVFKKNKADSLNDYSQKIIFILGMPRSGTTLAEQILSSHKNVYGAGELNFLKEAIEDNLYDKKGNFNLTSENLKKVKEYYLKKIKIFENKKEYLIDKAPLNFKWIGIISLIFPNSKIVHCKRNPMDICWSNYKNTFASKLMNYSYDFKDLAFFYKAYDDLMKFWINYKKINIFDLVYEELIIDKTKQTKRLLEFCDLDWDENCLNFHKNKKAVSTASLAQVRQPLYTSSIKKWESYSDDLAELEKLLIN
jgi:tetratricopeptide (TPR) repeat protein